MQSIDWSTNDVPSSKESDTDIADSVRASKRIDSSAPRWKKSKTGTADLKREKLLNDRREPVCTQSSIARDVPTRDIPTILNALAIRAKHLRETEAPTCVNSTTDTADPTRTKLLTDRDAPSDALSMTDSENKEPSLVNPNTANEEPIRLKLRSDSVAPPLM
jgi:hypothetical protein